MEGEGEGKMERGKTGIMGSPGRKSVGIEIQRDLMFAHGSLVPTFYHSRIPFATVAESPSNTTH